MKDLVKRSITAFVLGSLFWFAMIYLSALQFTFILLMILAQIIIFEWKNFFAVTNRWFWLIMPFYPILPFALLIALNHDPVYRNLLLVLFIIVSSHDTGSYLAGNFFGRHPILPSVSPKKTWEGFIGGYLCAVAGLAFVLWELKTMKPWTTIFVFCFFTCMLSLTGDLLESWLKRRAGIKDSGNILPGHGGFLDRFDGILFTVFFFYLLRGHIAHLLF